MPFTKEQALDIKKQLFEQVEKLPPENKEKIKEYIKSLDEDQLELFLKQQGIKIADGELRQTDQDKDAKEEPEKPIFQAIVKKEIPAYVLQENKKAMAILEINPLSKGHTIIIPKEQTTIEKIPKIAFSLAQIIAQRIRKKLKPREVKIETFSFQDYPAINIIPLYDDQPLKKIKAQEQELKSLQKKLSLKTRTKREPKISKEAPKKNLPEIKFKIP